MDAVIIEVLRMTLRVFIPSYDMQVRIVLRKDLKTFIEFRIIGTDRIDPEDFPVFQYFHHIGVSLFHVIAVHRKRQNDQVTQCSFGLHFFHDLIAGIEISRDLAVKVTARETFVHRIGHIDQDRIADTDHRHLLQQLFDRFLFVPDTLKDRIDLCFLLF